MPKKPMDYSKALVYKICCKDIDITDCYVGSTTNLVKRRIQHKSGCNNEKDTNHNYPIYQFIRNNGGWDNWNVVMVEEYPECKSREELLKYEREHFEMLGATLNKKIPSRTLKEYQKEWYEDNKEELNAKQREYNEKNKEKLYDRKNVKRREKVECEFCGSIISKSSLKIHQKSKKCLKAQGK